MARGGVRNWSGELKIDNKALIRKSLHKLGGNKWIEALEDHAIKATKDAAKLTMSRISQTVLDSFITGEEAKKKFKYNNYLGAVNHGYRLVAVKEGKIVGKERKVPDNLVKWGSVETVDGVKVYKLQSPARHKVFKINKQRRWRNATSGKVKYGNVYLNARGRRLKSKHFRHRVYYKTLKYGWIDYGYEYTFGKRKSQLTNNDASNPISFTEYKSKNISHINQKYVLKEREKSRGIRKDITDGHYRRVKKSDKLGRKGWPGYHPKVMTGKMDFGFVIYNQAPFADKLQREGYDVFPTDTEIHSFVVGGKMANVTRIWTKHIGKEFDKCFRKLK